MGCYLGSNDWPAGGLIVIGRGGVGKKSSSIQRDPRGRICGIC